MFAAGIRRDARFAFSRQDEGKHNFKVVSVPLRSVWDQKFVALTGHYVGEDSFPFLDECYRRTLRAYSTNMQSP